ncbi:cyclopropane-fatty-acyl-phospholipid synthase family protein [Catellatospora citrea]|uniref:cyclopropane-fatty-acyl-phospholipid synthase family protein n=1 Tax=Catellatospora citrea TaxID=53366 RepID=UPI00341059E8
MSTASIARELSDLAASALGVAFPVRVRAWDGSEYGPFDGPVLHIRDRTALRRLLWSPDELGLAQAYVVGELDVDGDLAEGLRRVWSTARAAKLSGVRVSVGARLRALRAAAKWGVLGLRPPAPDLQARLDGELHSRDRDRAAIGYHYDLSNEFYQRLLDPYMAYSCGYWTSRAPGYGLVDAQRDKLELICRKLDLRPGMRMLDVGCGWGSLSLYAAAEHGARVVAVTLSAQQHDHVAGLVAQRGLGDRVQVRLCDYRDVSDGPYEAVATVEMGEHVGRDGYPRFAARLHALLAPQGRLLVQQMSRGANAPGGGAFIESYVAPDMHMRPVGQTVDLLEQAGLEVRDVHAMREHYVWTVQAWLDTLEGQWEQFVALVGEPTARVWRLYLVGGALAFEEQRMGVDQILAVRPSDDGAGGMPDVRLRTPEKAAW